MTTVIIVDDQASIREFLKINLSSEVDIQIVGLAENGQDAIAQVGEHQPDIVLMDIEMPGKINGIGATEIIARRFPDTKVLLFTSQDDQAQLNHALKVGARGYVLKNTNIKDIGHIIRLAEKGFFQIGPILGNWDGSLHNIVQSNSSFLETEEIPSTVSAIVQQNSDYMDQSAGVSEMNHVISNLTSGLFQLQKTLKSQQSTIINLTNQYSQVQQEIRTKLKTDKSIFNGGRTINHRSKKASKPFSQRRQNILFVSSFLLGVFTVIVLILLIMTLGAAF